MPLATKKFARRIWRRVRRAVAPPPPAWGRIACLGYDVLAVSHYDGGVTLLNQQKTRCDLLLEWIGGQARPAASIIKPFMQREDVFPLVEQQEQLPWLKSTIAPRFLLMDSFAELTDQQFVHRRDGWSFACHYTDVKHPPEFEAMFDCRGLMPIERFEPAYASFFDWFHGRFPTAPVFFLQFPTALDNREVFKFRAAAISQTILQLAQTRPWLKSIEIPGDLVRPDAGNTFPYHYAPSTYQAFANAWRLADEQAAG